MDQRISLVTLGVDDLSRAIDFYAALGWRPHARSVPGEVAFFQAGGSALALWGRAALAADAGIDHDAGGWGGVVLAHNVAAPAEVDDLLHTAASAGGTVVRPGAATSWGGYSGLFRDPDGHAWEVAVNPDWRLTADGSIDLG